jgi:hypothetical protein
MGHNVEGGAICLVDVLHHLETTNDVHRRRYNVVETVGFDADQRAPVGAS